MVTEAIGGSIGDSVVASDISIDGAGDLNGYFAVAVIDSRGAGVAITETEARSVFFGAVDCNDWRGFVFGGGWNLFDTTIASVVCRKDGDVRRFVINGGFVSNVAIIIVDGGIFEIRDFIVFTEGDFAVGDFDDWRYEVFDYDNLFE